MRRTARRDVMVVWSMCSITCSRIEDMMGGRYVPYRN